MYDSNRPHPLLAQVSLTVSPFISLPSAVTLPYTYKSISSTLPPSITATADNQSDPAGKTRYVVSPTGGHVAHPDEILASCQALETHLRKTITDAERTIKEWEEGIRQRELAEKRRLAPGWLDRDEKLLQPEAVHASVNASKDGYAHGGDTGMSILDSSTREQEAQSVPAIAPRDEGEELDRVFGGLDMK
ncbi:conserved hypothetical protein [Talaromyces stipitatus ATCC 10500]|uniref:Uncharacterized protein n=1 Tax=Talaromyces stipitatus (strain ATCC 10500 / CBS 375.48 / QM 6759 / NRRL 1006) TaxID=441959 RepID=B8M9U8_TALSN|nr:uncharacterized protein TSTA_118660 [Talaromyces stipitatus ATCC 10500]EED18100.1 conserved hypothetical protein [Talaromyces stipitatus ATCC 10500]